MQPMNTQNTGVQNAGAQSQQNQWQAPYRHPISLFWPIVLIGLGVVLLLNNTNILPGNAWDWIWRLWPIVFIAWGLDGLLRREVVGPTLMIGMGTIFILANFGWISLNPIEVILRLWPIFLVAAGIGIIFDRRATGIVGALFGALLILLILGGALWFTGVRLESVGPLPGQRITQSLERATKANISIEPVAGSLRIAAMAEPTNLVEGTINLQGSESVRRAFSIDDGVATYQLKGENVFVGFSSSGGDWRTWNLKLNPEVPTALVVHLGAGDIDLDMTELTISSLSVNTAVGSTTITLPRQGRFTGTINSAIGSTTIVVPAGMGVRLQMSSGLTVANVPPGFEKRGNTYTSPSFDNASNRIDLDISQALGAITVRTQ